MSVAWAIFLASTAVAFYILIGYPIILALMRNRSAPQIAKDLRHEARVTAIVAASAIETPL